MFDRMFDRTLDRMFCADAECERALLHDLDRAARSQAQAVKALCAVQRLRWEWSWPDVPACEVWINDVNTVSVFPLVM